MQPPQYILDNSVLHNTYYTTYADDHHFKKCIVFCFVQYRGWYDKIHMSRLISYTTQLKNNMHAC